MHTYMYKKLNMNNLQQSIFGLELNSFNLI